VNETQIKRLAALESRVVYLISIIKPAYIRAELAEIRAELAKLQKETNT
jgi:hypothetical protein